jgi:hypothetical protein
MKSNRIFTDMEAVVKQWEVAKYKDLHLKNQDRLAQITNLQGINHLKETIMLQVEELELVVQVK